MKSGLCERCAALRSLAASASESLGFGGACSYFIGGLRAVRRQTGFVISRRDPDKGSYLFQIHIRVGV